LAGRFSLESNFEMETAGLVQLRDDREPGAVVFVVLAVSERFTLVDRLDGLVDLFAFAWRRLLAPLSGVALVAFVTVVSLNFLNRPPIEDALANLVEVENPSEHIGSISYKSQAENMFVVWLYDKESDIEVKTDMPEPTDDLLLQ
jgi:hypothetical protein